MLTYDLVLEQWKKNRNMVKHPRSLHKPEDLEIIKEQYEKGEGKALEICAKIEGRFGHILKTGEDYLKNMITDTTPGPCTFNQSPEHEMGVPHGIWKWDPMDPDYLTDEVTGTKVPNDEFREDLTLKTYWGKPQEFTYYSGKSMVYYGFHLYPSYSGLVRARKSVYMIEAAYKMALYFHITGKREYILKAKEILLRFADVYPYWLAHGMYGDIADMNPRAVGINPKSLPEGRTCLPPNEGKNEIHVGYWGLGRGSVNGMEGVEILLPAAVAYDLTAASGGILSDSEKAHIEKNLLLECASLIMNDTQLNNKSTGNNIGVLAAGIVTGVEELVNIGRDCFSDIILKWYLKDGSTPESPLYSMMVMRTLWALSEMLEGYRGVAGTDEVMAVYDWFRYQAVWKGMYDTLLQNYLYPASADSYYHSRLNTTYCEVLAHRFKRPEYIALLNESRGIEETEANPGVVFLPGEAPDIKGHKIFRDIFFPDFRQAYMRIGKDNMDGTLILNGSDWENHHHHDSLNLFYYYKGKEWLTDLGYLWDQPHKFMTERTAAHHLVVVDEEEQVTRGRKSSLNAFLVSPMVKLADMTSDVYPKTDEYRRISAVVDHGEGHYIADVFLVRGKAVKDYLIHGPDSNYRLDNMTKSPWEKDLPYDMEDGFVLDIKGDDSGIIWQNEGEDMFKVFVPMGGKEEIILADGFGQRAKTDLGAKIPYLMRRTEEDEYVFVSVMGASGDKPYIEGVKYQTDGDNKGVIIKVICKGGRQDTIIYSFEGEGYAASTRLADVSFNGILAVRTTVDEKDDGILLFGGNYLEIDGKAHEGSERNWKGSITGWDDRGFVTDVPFGDIKEKKGSFVLIFSDGRFTGYEIFDVVDAGGYGKLICRTEGGEGHMPLGGKSFIIYSLEVL